MALASRTPLMLPNRRDVHMPASRAGVDAARQRGDIHLRVHVGRDTDHVPSLSCLAIVCVSFDLHPSSLA
jgi:hypothetical protein